MSKNDLPVILYGAGRKAAEEIDKIKRELNPVCFCDANKNKQGTEYLGFPVLSIDEAIIKFGGGYNIYLTISNRFKHNAIEYLLDKGIDKERILNSKIDSWNVDFLGNSELHPQNGCMSLFLCSGKKNLSEIKNDAYNKRVAVFTGDKLSESIIVLNPASITPAVLCSNIPEFVGEKLFGYDIISAWDVISNPDDYYVIIPNSNHETRFAIIRQLLYNGINEYSFIKGVQLPNFDKMKCGDILKESYFYAINKAVDFMLSFDGHDIYEDYWQYVSFATLWYHVYEWIYDDNKGKNELTMLEIGPGIGLLSYAVKNLINPVIDWINLSEEVAADIVNDNFMMNIELDDIPQIHQYDIIVMTEVIEHFSYNPVPTLQKIGKHLKPDGRFYISCPHGSLCPYPSWKDMPAPGTVLPFTYHDHVYEYSPEELREICTAAGFEIVREAFAMKGRTNICIMINK